MENIWKNNQSNIFKNTWCLKGKLIDIIFKYYGVLTKKPNHLHKPTKYMMAK